MTLFILYTETLYHLLLWFFSFCKLKLCTCWVITPHSPLSRALGNYRYTFCLYGFDYFKYLISVELHSICLSVTDWLISLRLMFIQHNHKSLPFLKLNRFSCEHACTNISWRPCFKLLGHMVILFLNFWRITVSFP